MFERTTCDHLMLGMICLMGARMAITAVVDSNVVTNLSGEGALARTSRFEAAVHFTPTTRTCMYWLVQRML